MFTNLKSDAQYFHKAEKGTGSAMSKQIDYLREHKQALQERKTHIFKLIQNPDRTFRGEPTNWHSIDALIQANNMQVHFVLSKNWETEGTPATTPMTDKLRAEYQLPAAERAQRIHTVTTELQDLNKSNAAPEIKAQKIIEIVEQAYISNKVALSIIDKTQSISVFDTAIAEDTKEIAKTVFEMAENSAITKSFFDCFKGMSNGQTLNHIARVTAISTSFLQYYNQNILSGRFLLKDSVFKEYRPLYTLLFPNAPEELLKAIRLFKVGTLKDKPLSEQKDIMLRWCLGFYLHDIGKFPELDYFEGNLGFDKNKVQQHVFTGAGLGIRLYANESAETIVIIGDHHNGLFHPDEYGLTRMERKIQGQQRPFTISISDNFADYTRGDARGFLPVELLAFVDVFDAHTDASRVYKKPLSPHEAIDMIYTERVLKQKADPILFDIFADFMRSQGVLVPAQYGLSVKLARNRL